MSSEHREPLGGRLQLGDAEDLLQLAPGRGALAAVNGHLFEGGGNRFQSGFRVFAEFDVHEESVVVGDGEATKDAAQQHIVPDFVVGMVDASFPGLLIAHIGLSPLSVELEGRHEEGKALNDIISHGEEA